MDAGRHPLIEVLTHAEVTGCDGGPGDFTVRVRKHPRYVREDQCVACGLCVDACPQVGGNEFDVGLKARKAIYRPFPQSVPSTYVVDKGSCLNFLGFLTEKQRKRLGKVERAKRKKRRGSRSTPTPWFISATGRLRWWNRNAFTPGFFSPRRRQRPR